MSNQKDLKTRIFAQKLIDDLQKRSRDSHEDWLITHDDFYRYSNKELFEYLNIGYSELVRILADLKSRGLIFQYECLDTKEASEKNKKEGLESYRTTGFPIDKAAKYEECVVKFPDGFFEKAEVYLAQPSDITDINSGSGLILYLDKNGNLWHGDESNKHCYSMGETLGRFFILQYLVDNKGYQATSSITSAFNAKFSKEKIAHDIRTDIAKIRRNIKESLDIDDLIQSKKNSGYRINPNYLVSRVK
jgi:hypothetical protein